MKLQWKRIFLVGLFVVVVAGGANYLLRRKSNQLPEAPVYGEQPLPVTVEETQRRKFAETRSYLAEVESSRTTSVAPRVRAAIETIYVDENDRVRRGDVLMELDRREINRKIASLKQTIEQVRSEKRARRAEKTSLQEKRDYWKISHHDGLYDPIRGGSPFVRRLLCIRPSLIKSRVFG